MADPLRIAYVVYWGACEPLGRTVAVPAVRELARWVNVTLVSFEKPDDRSDPERFAEVARALDAANVAWAPLDYHSSPPVISSFFDLWTGARRVKDLHRDAPFDLVLGRTFVGGLVGALAARGLGVPFVYYQDACWPEEQVDAGKWARGSFPDAVARRLEDVSFREADGVVVLTHRTLERLRESGRVSGERPAVVAPTTSGVIDQASPGGLRRARSERGPLRLLYLGSVSGRYPLDAILDFLTAARCGVPGSTLSVYTHRDRELVHREAESRGLGDAVRVDRADPSELPEVLRSHDAGLVFLRPGLSARCQTPTKVGEYLAFGLPVVSTAFVGDVPELLTRHEVGVVIEELSSDAYDRGVEALGPLVRDLDLPRRANAVANDVFDAEAAARRQARLFDRVLGSDLSGADAE